MRRPPEDAGRRQPQRRAREVADDRRRLQAARARVPGHLDLEDPLPRGPEAAHAAAHAGRLPALHAGRRGPPAHDPAPAARRVPAAAGDPPGAGGAAAPTARCARSAPRRADVRAPAPHRRRPCRAPARVYSLEDVLEETRRRPPRSSRELEEFGVIKGESRDGERYYDETEREIVRAVDRARALRRRRAQPARLPHLGRPRGRPAAADPRPVAALAQSRAAQRGGRGAREPRRGRHAPQAPAADPRPAQARGLTA